MSWSNCQKRALGAEALKAPFFYIGKKERPGWKGGNRMENILEAEALKFAYISEDETYHFALNGIDLEIKEGEFLSLIHI